MGQPHPSPAAHCQSKSRDSLSLASGMTNPSEKCRRRCQTRSPCGAPARPTAAPERGAERPHTGGSRGRGGGGGGTPRPGPRRAPLLRRLGLALRGGGVRGRPGVPGGSRGAAAARPAPIDFPLWSFATKGRIQTLPRFVQSARRAPARHRLDPSPPSTPNRTPTLTTNQRPAARPISAGEPEHGLCV